MSNPNAVDDFIKMRKEREEQQQQPVMKPLTPQEAANQIVNAQPKTTQEIITDGAAELERLKQINASIEAEAAKYEKLKLQMSMAGKGFIHPPAEKPESPAEKWARDRKKFYEGTGLDPTPSKK